MPTSIQLGPLALSVAYLVTLASIALGVSIAGLLSRRQGADASAYTWRIVLLALLAARLGFVWRYRGAYIEAPLDLLNIRDGGWDAQMGVIAAWAYTLLVVHRQVNLRKPLLAGVGAASAVWLAGAVAMMASPDQGPRWPAHLTLQDLARQEAPLARHAGRPVVMNLWATWCPPCRREMPVLQRGQREHQDVDYIFVNQGETAEQVQAFMRGQALDLRHVLLDHRGAVAAAFSAAGYPTTLFFDARGRLVSQRMGELSWATLNDKVQAIRAPATGEPLKRRP